MLSQLGQLQCAFLSTYKSRGAGTVFWSTAKVVSVCYGVAGTAEISNFGTNFSGRRRLIDFMASPGTFEEKSEDIETALLPLGY